MTTPPEQTVMPDSITIPRDLLESLLSDAPCWFDHHGGCQEHGYLSLTAGQECPMQEAKRLLADAQWDVRAGRPTTSQPAAVVTDSMVEHYAGEYRSAIHSKRGEQIINGESDSSPEACRQQCLHAMRAVLEQFTAALTKGRQGPKP